MLLQKYSILKTLLASMFQMTNAQINSCGSPLCQLFEIQCAKGADVYIFCHKVPGSGGECKVPRTVPEGPGGLQADGRWTQDQAI